MIAHLIGDYLIQTDWMAANKKKSTVACMFHIITYMIPFMFCDIAAWQFYLIAAQHFLQDRWNFIPWLMKVKGSAKFMEPPLGPWSIIVTDNVVHIVWMYLVMEVMAR
jgi:hypothetical protein